MKDSAAFVIPERSGTMSRSRTHLTNAIDEYVMGSQAREIMMRSMYDRQPYEGIAADLGISRDTVGRTVRRWRGEVERHL